MRPATARQSEVFEFVRWNLLHQRSVSIRDIQFYFGMSGTTGVLCHLLALEKKGFIQRPVDKDGRHGVREIIVNPVGLAVMEIVDGKQVYTGEYIKGKVEQV